MKPERIQQRMVEVPAWTPVDRVRAMMRTFAFNHFESAAAFVDRVGQLSGAYQRWPDVRIRGAQVTLTLPGATSGELTEDDFDLAVLIEHQP